MRTKNLIHPGEILLEEFLIPMGISQNRLSVDIRVPAPRINAIVHGKRAITADTALRLGRYFKMEPQFWLNLQDNYDLGNDYAYERLLLRAFPEGINAEGVPEADGCPCGRVEGEVWDRACLWR